MGFNSVYRCLQEIFPQVDARLLKAVAIEHPKDADLAAGIVLTEVLPLMSKTLPAAIPPQDKGPGAPINVEVESEEEGNSLGHRQLVEDVDVGSSFAPHSISVEITKTADCYSGPDLNVTLDESVLSNASNSNDGIDKFLQMNEIKELNIFQNAEDNFTEEISNKISQETSNGFRQEANENFDQERVQVDVDGEKLISSGICQEMESEQNYLCKEAASTSNNGNRSANQLNEEWLDFEGSSAVDYDVTFYSKNHLLDKCETALVEVESSEAQPGQGNTRNSEDNFSGDISTNIAQETSNGFRQEANENFDQGRVHVDVDGEKLISSGICQEMEAEQNYLSKEAASTNNNGNRNANHLNEEWLDFEGSSAVDYDVTICDKNHLLDKCETALVEVESSEAQAGRGNTPNSKDSLQSEFDSGLSIAVGENLESGYSFFKQDFCVSETGDVEDEIGENNAVSQFSQVCRIDLLEKIIDEAKTNKKTLFSSMESLINLMREVELQEKAAEQANMEAARGGSDILVRVEEYKTMLAHANEANDMHAGEVYGEKAILATELRELQSRLLGLSDERDKSLAILDEMRQILEARLAAAEQLMRAAELEKLEKEESARKALAEQEAMMEKVVHESVKLQQEAEENSKLREFLMDRGRVVDMLQGEISVICEDVRLLKEKFDANLPLSKSFTSSQTSCILASSGSSHKTLAFDTGSEHSDSSEIRKTSPAASNASLSSQSGHEEERSKADHKALLDDGWDIFEKDAEL